MNKQLKKKQHIKNNESKTASVDKIRSKISGDKNGN
jgi:hypothetical protein